MDTDSISQTIDDLSAGPWDEIAKIVITVILAVIISAIVSSLIRRTVNRAISRAHRLDVSQIRNIEDTSELSASLLENRVAQRATAIGTLARSTAVIVIWSIAVMMILSELGLNIGPLLASAGVLGVVLGFGAQTLVADYLAGISMTLEDQLGVGDVVDCGVVIGTVEEVALRYTRIRDFYGVVWYVRNGTMTYVANQSQGWTYAIVDIALPYDSDLDHVESIVNSEGQIMAADPNYDNILMDPPVYAGLEDARGDAVVVRVLAKAVPAQQYVAARLIRGRMKGALDAAGIHIPIAHMKLTDFPGQNAPKP